MNIRPVIITDAQPSAGDQLRSRRRKYVVMMGLRIVCLVAAAYVVSAEVPYALLWVLLLLAGMVLFPWVAVLVANDRPPRRPSRVAHWFRGAGRRQVAPQQRAGEHEELAPGDRSA